MGEIIDISTMTYDEKFEAMKPLMALAKELGMKTDYNLDTGVLTVESPNFKFTPTKQSEKEGR